MGLEPMNSPYLLLLQGEEVIIFFGFGFSLGGGVGVAGLLHNLFLVVLLYIIPPLFCAF